MVWTSTSRCWLFEHPDFFGFSPTTGGWSFAAPIRAASKANNWRMSINVSASQLKDADFPEMISCALGETGLSSSDIRIEVTESALVDGEVATEALERLRELGVRVLIDDFGTKYSSLSYITRLPIDELKIDRSFVRDLVDNESILAVVSAILTIGKSLGLTITAEGVETEAQLIQLLSLGCDLAQGYLFERLLSPQACFAALESFTPGSWPIMDVT